MAAAVPITDTTIRLVAEPAAGGDPLAAERSLTRGPMRVGRGAASLLGLDHPSVSREHFSIEWHDHAPWLTDLSSQGTVLNGRRLVHGQGLALDGPAEILVPGYRIRVEGPVLEARTVYQPPRTYGGLTAAEWLIALNAAAAVTVATVYALYI